MATLRPAPLLLLLAACGDPPRPNVLLVTLDTTRADFLGAYGATTGATPTLDRFAAEGFRFDRAYTVTPLTIPAHSSMHTGLYPPRHGVRDNGDFFLGEDATTLAERLSGAGYRTMAAVGAEVTSHHWGFAQGFSAYFDDMGPGDAKGNRWRVERRGDAVIDDALGWLDANGKADVPWFAWVHLFDPHHPYAAPEPFASQLRGKPYAAEIAYTDSQVGRLRAWLEANEQLDDTWIFVVADHGEGLGSHGESLHGVLLYDATTRIPFIVRPPAGGQGAAIGEPVSLVDLTPTILGVTGLPAAEGLDGEDLRPLFAAEAPRFAERAVYAESRYAWHHYGWAPLSALVTNDHKLIDSTTPELYARADVAESADLAMTEVDRLTTITGRLDTMVAAMEPAVGATRADMSPERVSQLEALGYLTTGGSEGPPTDGLPDPVKQLPVLKKLEAARTAFRDGDLDATARALEEALAADPNLIETRLLQANLLFRQGKLPEALVVLERLQAERPGSQTLAMMGSVKVASGQFAEGAKLLGEAVTIDPYQASVWSSYLHALLLASDPRLGAEAARGGELLPDVPTIQGMKGVALTMQGRFPAAELLLMQALTADPHQPFVNHALGMVFKSRGETMKAEGFFDEEIRLYPPAIPSRKMLVEILAGQKRYDEQIAQLEAIRAKEPLNHETLHSLAQALFNLKRFPESAEVVDTCRLQMPSYPGCALLEANVLKKLGKDAEAQAAFERATELAKTTP